MEKVRYEEMLPHEIVARRKKCPAAFIGLGGLEWHGEHQAVGLDALKAEKLCELAAAKSGGFAMPTIWWGEPRTWSLMEANHNADHAITDKMGLSAKAFTTKHFGVSEDDQVSFYIQLLVHTLKQMNTLGMKAVCFLSGHYPLRGPAEQAIKQFHKVRRFRGTRAWCGIEFDYPVPPNMDRAGGDHAAKWETSYLSYLRPDCVDLTVFRGRQDEPLIGIWGEDPRTEASVEIGRTASHLVAKGMAAKAKSLIAEVDVAK